MVRNVSMYASFIFVELQEERNAQGSGGGCDDDAHSHTYTHTLETGLKRFIELCVCVFVYFKINDASAFHFLSFLVSKLRSSDEFFEENI